MGKKDFGDFKWNEKSFFSIYILFKPGTDGSALPEPTDP